MNSDSYKIIISLSHGRISFEYWLRDAEDKLTPMPTGHWPAPLAFYCTSTGIKTGEDAARAAHAGMSGAYDDYFSLIKTAETYTLGSQRLPVRNLLVDASESLFEDFFREVLCGRLGSLRDNRATMPLTIVCDADIQPNERALLKGLFNDCGYSRARVVDYASYIGRYVRGTLAKEYVCDNVLVAWTEGEDLFFTLFDVAKDDVPAQESHGRLGIDPRKEYVKNLIWERFVGLNPWINKQDHEDAVDKLASDFLNSNLPLVNDKVQLSDGNTYYYKLEKNQIDFLIRGNEGAVLREKLEGFLRKNGLSNRSRTLLLLRGVAAGNDYFEQNLSPGFSKTIKSDIKLRDNTMSLILGEPHPEWTAPPVKSQPPADDHVDPVKVTCPDSDKRLKELKKRWREIRAASKGKANSGQPEVAVQMLKSFKEECETVSGTDDIVKEIEGQLQEHLSESQTPAAESIDKKLVRKWREIRAMSRGKVGAGNMTGAMDTLRQFMNEAAGGADSLMAEVKGEIETIANRIKKVNNESSAHKPAQSGPKPPKPVKAPAPKPVKDECAELMRQGKLRDARDWCRANGDRTRANLLSDIIRDQRSVETRKRSLEECRQTKDRNQIDRIIKELGDYLDLCAKVNYDAPDIRQLLADFKKIK